MSDFFEAPGQRPKIFEPKPFDSRFLHFSHCLLNSVMRGCLIGELLLLFLLYLALNDFLKIAVFFFFHVASDCGDWTEGSKIHASGYKGGGI